MAGETYSTGTFPVTVSAIEERAYILQYENTLLPKLFKPIGQGQKGNLIQWPYFDPTSWATAASVLTESVDFVTYKNLTNASKIVQASEFGVISFVSDQAVEVNTEAIVDILSKDQGLAVAAGLEAHCVGAISGAFTGTVNATNATNGLTYTAIAAAKAEVDGRMLTVPGEKNLVINEYAYFYTAKSTYAPTYAAAVPNLGDEVLQKWHINTVFGDVRIFRDNYISVDASNFCRGAMFVRDAVAIWTPRTYRLKSQRDESARGTEYISTMRAGASVLIPGYGINVTCYATAPSGLTF